MVKADICDSCGRLRRSDLMKEEERRRRSEAPGEERHVMLGDGEGKNDRQEDRTGGNKNSCRQLMDS